MSTRATAFDVAVIGGGMAGMATAARLQARGYSTTVIEAHGQVGGCAGFYRRRGFAFDVGATTLVDFEPGGVGGHLLEELGLTLDAELLPGYVAWLPDRQVTLHRDPAAWRVERLRQLGDTPLHRQLWGLLDLLAESFWAASRAGVKLPIQGPADLLRAARTLPPRCWPLTRYLRWTLGDALRRFHLRDDRHLVGLLSMLVEDTVHATVDAAPLVNAALGITIRGAGLARARGGMWGFWQAFVARYRALGGTLRVGTRVLGVEGRLGAFSVSTSRGPMQARQVVSAVPLELTSRLAMPAVGEQLRPALQRDRGARGSALVVFLGVPEEEVADQAYTHHQLLQDCGAPLGNGNNMFVSVSAPGDTRSAPPGHRTVMLSTHCDLDPWRALSPGAYAQAKAAAGEQLVRCARRVYPRLGQHAVAYEVATPRTYARYTGRPDGAVGGVRQNLGNSNQHAVAHDVGVPGFWLVGDDTWPGLGTVACCLGSRIVAELAERAAPAHLPFQLQPEKRHAMQ